MSNRTEWGRNRGFAIYTGFSFLVAIFVYFALCADAFYNEESRRGSLQFAQMVPSLPVRNPSMAERNDQIIISSPMNGSRYDSPFVSVHGQAPAGSAIALLVNGAVVDGTRAHRSGFRFDQVPLPARANLLQVRFYTDDGSSESSRTIQVFYPAGPFPERNKEEVFGNSTYNISRGNVSQPAVALTFNVDSAEGMPALLGSLEASNLTATMFLTSAFMEEHPEMVRTISAKHEIASLVKVEDHSLFTTVSANDEIKKASSRFFTVTGKRIAPFWRSTGAMKNARLIHEANQLHIGWSHPLLMNEVAAQIHKDAILTLGMGEPAGANGAIILVKTDAQILLEIARTYAARGYRFVPVSLLLSNSAVSIAAN